jgi:hypothetical protein
VWPILIDVPAGRLAVETDGREQSVPVNALAYLRTRWSALVGALMPLSNHSPRPPSVGVYRALMPTEPSAHAAVVTTLNRDDVLKYVPAAMCQLITTLQNAQRETTATAQRQRGVSARRHGQGTPRTYVTVVVHVPKAVEALLNHRVKRGGHIGGARVEDKVGQVRAESYCAARAAPVCCPGGGPRALEGGLVHIEL